MVHVILALSGSTFLKCIFFCCFATIFELTKAPGNEEEENIFCSLDEMKISALSYTN